MQRARKLFTAIFTCWLAVSLPSAQGAEPAREQIGVVLAGGGARGIAHVGVLRALEELQVPVDTIAGTSMGALVGGLYATGMDAGELEGVVAAMDWESAFEDTIPRSEQPVRRRADDYDYPIKVSLAIKEGELSFPLGLIQGQQVRMAIKELMVEVDHIRDFDQLPIPYRAVATNIETGEAYVFADGEIVTAMRASMSIPGLLAPVEHDGLLLVDGGVANNVPVDVARAMGAQRLIVVDIGTPLKRREEIKSLVSVADQMLGFLTRKNSLEQLATLHDSDFLIRPDLGDLGMLDFADEASIIERGYQSTMAMQEQLIPLALADSAWADYLGSKTLASPTTPIIEFIAINNDSPISDEIIRARISQAVGETLDREQLRRDIADIYALDYFEIIDFQVVAAQGRTGLQIKAREKTWGADDIKLGLNLVTDLEGASEINLGGSYRLKGLNRSGAEFYGRAQLGDTILLSGEVYQPVDIGSEFFIAPRIAYHDRELLTLGPEFDLDETYGSWRVRDLQLELSAGANIFRNSELRLGLFRDWGESSTQISSSELIDDGSFDKGGLLASWRYDDMDDVFFPSRGSFLFAEYENNLEELGADQEFERWQVLGQSVLSFGADQGNTVIVTAKTGQSAGAANEPQNYYQLGGLFNLSGLQQDIFSARQMAFVMAQYQHRLSDDSVIPLNMPVYAGFSVEGGQLASERSELDFGDWQGAGSVYLVIKSPIGPLYLAYGQTAESRRAVYIALGWPFLGHNTRIGR